MRMEYLDRPPAGWFVVEVMPKKAKRGKRDWVALMMDVDPDEIERSVVQIAFRSAWVSIPGQHSKRADACDVLVDMMATRH
jgi:hypothetical protein